MPQSRAPAPQPDEPFYVDDDHAAIAGFAEAYLDEDEREGFVDHLMERRGYTRIQSWGPRADPEPDPQPDPQQPRAGARGGGQGGGQRRSGYFKR